MTELTTPTGHIKSEEVDRTKVLIVERKLLSSLLTEQGYGAEAVSSGEEALSVLGTKPFEIAIIDIRLPGMNGLDLLREVKRQWPDTQVIIMTSHASLESSVNALRSGAYDYLDKPFDDLDVISAVVGRAAEKIRLTKENAILVEDLIRSNDELEQANRTLRDLAIRDGLTGLYNHRYIQESISLELERSSRHARTFCLIFVDVDHFKNYNDTNGHVEGDYVLRSLASILRTCFRKVDLVSRYGGEEFMILLPETLKKEAARLAEEIRKRIEGHPFHGRENQPSGKITVSMGVASFPEDGTDASTLIKKSDAALYRAKEQGRNRICEA
ncbi:MAG: diguanylate cyclase [Thermodesulfovibrionales bacterium]